MNALRVLAIVAILTATARADDPVNLLQRISIQCGVSSTVANPNILPRHLVDNDPETAWNSRTGDLIGAWVGFRLPATAHLTSIKLTVGFTKVDEQLGDLFVMNPRIKRVRVTRDGAKLVEAALDPEKRELQEIAVTGGGGEYRIEVLAYVPGTKAAWKEINISELQAWGTFGPGTPLGSATVHVGRFDEPHPPTQFDCIAAAGGAKATTMDNADLREDLGVCAIGRGDDVETVWVSRTPVPTVLARLPPMKQWSRPGSEQSLRIWRFPWLTGEDALRVKLSRTDSAGTGTKFVIDEWLYRLDGNRAVAIYAAHDEVTVAPPPAAAAATECTIAPVKPAKTPPSLTVTCVTKAREATTNKITTTTETRTYKWAGTAYQKM